MAFKGDEVPLSNAPCHPVQHVGYVPFIHPSAAGLTRMPNCSGMHMSIVT